MQKRRSENKRLQLLIWAFQNFVFVALPFEFSEVDKGNIIADFHHRIHIVGIYDGCDIIFNRNTTYQFVNHHTRFGVETRVWFIAKQVFRIQENRPPQYEGIFQNLATLYGKPVTPKTSVFVEEIAHALKTTMGKNRIKTHYLIDNHLFPLVILPKTDDENDKPTVIRIDGRLAEGSFFNADWERRLLKDLAKTGVNVASVWSYNWWKNPKIEAASLTATIEDFDNVVTAETVLEEVPAAMMS